MIEYSKVFLDTTPLIYFLDSDVNFGEKTKSILEEILSNDKTIVSSVITCEEYLVIHIAQIIRRRSMCSSSSQRRAVLI